MAILAKANISNHLFTHRVIELLCQFLLAHAQVRAESRIRQTDKESLIIDISIQRIAGYHWARYFWPCLNQPLLQQGYRVGITYVALNEAVEPLDDARVRKAMQLALDRDSIMRVACNGRGSVENGILPRGLIGHNPALPEIPFDQELAKRLLTEAGFEDGFELPMVMPDTANQSMRDVMNLLIFMWRRVGIYARVAYVSEEEFIEQRSAGLIACYAATWSADFNDPDNFMYTFFGSQANTRLHGLCYGNAGEMAVDKTARVCEVFVNHPDHLVTPVGAVPVGADEGVNRTKSLR